MSVRVLARRMCRAHAPLAAPAASITSRCAAPALPRAVVPTLPAGGHPLTADLRLAARAASNASAASAASPGGNDPYENVAHIRGAVEAEVPPDVVDWANHSEPVGDLFGAPPAHGDAAAWAAFRLSDAQLDTFARDGYVSNVRVLSEAQCDALLADYNAFLDPESRHPGHGLFHEFHDNQSGDPDNVLLHALGQWRITPRFHDLVFHPGIAVPASQLMGGAAVRFWHDQLFAKPPRHGGGVAWHQDYSYWTRTVPMNHLTVHIALDTQTQDNGTLQFIPGSHKWHRDGKPLPITSDDFADMDSIQAILTPEERAAFAPKPALLKKGEASFHHAMLVHGSFGSRADTPRRATVVNYFADGTVSDTDEPMLAGVPTVAKGQRMQGKFFPVVFDPSWAE